MTSIDFSAAISVPSSSGSSGSSGSTIIGNSTVIASGTGIIAANGAGYSIKYHQSNGTISSTTSEKPTPPDAVSVLFSNNAGQPVIQFLEAQADHTTLAAVFEPDISITTYELSLVMMLMSVTAGVGASDISPGLSSGLLPISFIKKHNLERHFRLSQV